MPNIHKLPENVINQIAAGEVVEKPANLVKELIENSLDAGADQIEVTIDDGGRTVSVIDNGSGIAKEDMVAALERHHTSKIQDTADLWKLKSYGFRGEALASLAAISRLQLISRPEGASVGHALTCDFGVLSDIKIQARDKGTTVNVRELFENVPARLKFLKTPSHEIHQIRNVVKALALVNPNVEFRVKQAGKLVDLFSKSAGRKERTQQVLEQKEVFEGQAEVGDVRVQVCFCSPHTVAGSSRQIWLFVQNRWVQDRGLQAAVMDAYRGLLMHGEYPMAAVFVECDTQSVDVNVHPTKSQVKFRDSSSAFRAVQRAIREALEKTPWLPKTVAAEKPAILEGAPSTQQTTQQTLSFEAQGFDSVMMPQKISLSSMSEFVKREPSEPSFESTPISDSAVQYWSSLQVVGQLNLTYIVTQSSDKMVLIDQHAAHERVAYERLMRGFQNGELEVQDFLIPLAVTLEPDELEAILDFQEELAQLGFDVDQGGADTLFVRSAPVIVSESGVAAALQKMADDILAGGESFAVEKIISDVCATLACHSVVRAGQALSLEEMQTLLQDMDAFPFSSFCPHGRPVSVEVPFQRLEKDFGRIV